MMEVSNRRGLGLDKGLCLGRGKGGHPSISAAGLPC